MSFGDIPTTTVTSEMEPSQIMFDGLQLFALADRGVTGGFFSSVAGVQDRHPNFIIYLMCDCYTILYFDFIFARWMIPEYIFICKYVQTGVICWAEERPKCNVMPAINFFFLFSWLNGSAGRRRG